MIRNAEPISSLEFNKGLVTRSDFLKGDINSSPNTMDVQWNFDASLHKRFGSSSTNTIAIGGIISGNTRIDQIGTDSLLDYNGNTPTLPGIQGTAPDFTFANNGGNVQTLLLHQNSGAFMTTAGAGNLSLSCWTYPYLLIAQNNTIIQKGSVNSSPTALEYRLVMKDNGGGMCFNFSASPDGISVTTISSNAFQPIINTTAWYHLVAWYSSASHIGLSVNLITTTASFTGIYSGTGAFYLATTETANASQNTAFDGRIDEVGIWKKVLSSAERTDLYNGGSGNSYTAANASWLVNSSGTLSTGISNYWKMDDVNASGYGWASFDFGASSIRWYTVAAGTGLYASSNLGTTFVVFGTSRTQNYQYLDRSKNVLIATSDSRDPTLYWAGSATTFAITLAPNSAPQAKFSVNYNGFLVLLNSQDSNGTVNKRRFSYADENLQLTDPWTNQFDLPSSDDDEITASFILYKFLYVSTRYRIFRLSFVGGNPDWSFLKVKDWGYVPRTVRIVSMQGGGQYALGLDWNHRQRLFDGFDDRFISDNVENDNGLCEFAMNKISYAGSGLLISHAELNPITQEYRLNVAVGTQSTQTTHSLVLNVRNLAFYPYKNQQWQTMCMAESNNQKHLMAVDRSGFVFILDSGNLDKGVTPVNEVYDSPPLFNKLPEITSKGKQVNFFFGVTSSGTLFLQDRVDLSNQWSPMKPLSNSKGETAMSGTENVIKILRTFDVPSTFNTWQFRLTSSANTATPWEMDRLDFFQQGFGLGKGNNG